MNKITSSLLGDSYYEIRHASGLTVLVYPKPNYATTYGIIGTNYGSIDAVNIPEGTAHFLEHKLFESEELDAFDRFAATGASANAYTTFDKTCYLFSCSDNAKENLRILLDFVRHPYFTEETVQKEQGIIGQEIQMYQDEPGWRVLFNLLGCLYHNHPVKIDIAGTKESIAQITAETLHDCYRKFYTLQNMALAVAGNISVEDVLSVCDEVLGTEPEPSTYEGRVGFEEPDSIVSTYVEQTFPVTMPSFALGFKEPAPLAPPTLRERILTGLILDYIAGDTSELFNRMLNEGLVNGTFGYEYFAGPGYRTVLFTGDARNPEKVAEEIKKEIALVKEKGIREKDFCALQKMNYGQTVMGYNGVDGLANELIASSFEGYRLFDELEIYKTVTVQEAEARLKDLFLENQVALSVVKA